jgi:hypothetical protein
MNTLLLSRIQHRALAVAAALALSGAVLLAQEAAAPANAQRTDGQIEMDVVQALDASQALKNDLITAATIQGQVTLSGTVASDADRQLAESIVKKVNGVAGVKDNLKVGNPADDQNAMGVPADDSGAPAGDQAENAPAPDQSQPAYAPPANTPQQGNAPQSQPQYGNNYPQQQQPGYGRQPNYGQQQAGPGYPPPGYGQGYPPPPGSARQPYNRPTPSYTVPRGPITVGPGSVLQVRTNDWVDSKKAQPGTPIDFTVIRDVTVNGYLAIPRGATAHGVVTETKNAGALSGTPELALRLTSLDLGGRNYPLDSDEFKVKGPNKAAHTAGNAIGGALIGALIGGAAGGGGGAAIGAAAGGTVGTAASAASNPRAWIPAEALVTFHLNTPLTVDPVSQEEASRLAQGLYPGGPQLYRRGYGYAAYPPGYYGYPPVYYRPYYLVNGYYYWR